MKYYIGYDIGSSAIKAALVNSTSGESLGLVHVPEKEMDIIAPKSGWAEQDPTTWWEHVCKATHVLLKQTAVLPKDIQGIGISYQMHGLVLVDSQGASLRNSIIWCDGRAVQIGKEAYDAIGHEKCNLHLLNSPANFTTSKLKWVASHEPNTYNRAHKLMLPGDYIAFRLSGEINSTISGLSEATLWDFKDCGVAHWLLDHFELTHKLIPNLVDTFSLQSKVSARGAQESGLLEGTPILYRAGDQPNNALSLNVFEPGEIAASGGTSGVVYAISEKQKENVHTGINNFAHVNHTSHQPRIGKLLCINGAGILYRWLQENLNVSSYDEMNHLAATIPIGSGGVTILPFGNGPERMLDNLEPGVHLGHINLNTHSKAHICRAALEGIAFSFVYGIELLKKDGVSLGVIRAGNDNLFRSDIFSETIATLIDQPIEIYNTTGAIGAARACNISLGKLDSLGEQIMNHDFEKRYVPTSNKKIYREAYDRWQKELKFILKK